MELIHLFYSWQSDRDSKLCRSFIEQALEIARDKVEADRQISLIIDSDTKGVSGTPLITPTILGKIDGCNIFLADVTFVGRADSEREREGKLLPNPNVMFEYGYARQVLDDRQVLLAFNGAFGSFKDLPFDLALMRRPTEYSAAPGIPDRARRDARAAYGAVLADHIGQVVDFVLKRRLQAQMSDEEVVGAARERLALLASSRLAGDAPAIISKPLLMVGLTPLVVPGDHAFDNARMKVLRHEFVPAGFPNNRRVDAVNSRQWASHEPLRTVPGMINREARWSTRVLRQGALEMMMTVGYQVEDDPTIGLELHRLEAEIVDASTRLAALAVEAGFSGPALLVAVLDDLEASVPYAAHHTGSFGKCRNLPLGELVVAELRETNAAALKPLLDALWLEAGFDDGSPSFSSGEWDGASGQGPYRLG